GEEIINVDFDFFDPKDSDFHSIKTLLKQLFSSDSELFELSELTELIVNQPSVGTTVKVDGSDSDPFAFLTVLNINEHKKKLVKM
ncbi:10877_t:CDS:2, partial [Entrophospora sp. SA101]